MLSGCATTNQPGIETSTDAVEHLLRAADTGDLESAKIVVNGVSDAQLEDNLEEIRSFIDASGGLDQLTVRETEQFGAEHVMEIRVMDSDLIAIFNVIDDAEGIYVIPDGIETPDDDEPSSDITPPDETGSGEATKSEA